MITGRAPGRAALLRVLDGSERADIW